MVESTPSATYDRIAQALSPLATGGVIALNVAVAQAAQAVEEGGRLAANRIADLRSKNALLLAELNRDREAHAAEVAALAAQRDQERRVASEYVEAAREALKAMEARLAPLERLCVLAAARWEHEGGPEPLRAALAECSG